MRILYDICDGKAKPEALIGRKFQTYVAQVGGQGVVGWAEKRGHEVVFGDHGDVYFYSYDSRIGAVKEVGPDYSAFCDWFWIE